MAYYIWTPRTIPEQLVYSLRHRRGTTRRQLTNLRDRFKKRFSHRKFNDGENITALIGNCELGEHAASVKHGMLDRFKNYTSALGSLYREFFVYPYPLNGNRRRFSMFKLSYEKLTTFVIPEFQGGLPKHLTRKLPRGFIPQRAGVRVHNWTGTIRVMLQTNVINPPDLLDFLDRAGKEIGLGSMVLPAGRSPYGKFERDDRVKPIVRTSKTKRGTRFTHVTLGLRALKDSPIIWLPGQLKGYYPLYPFTDVEYPLPNDPVRKAIEKYIRHRQVETKRTKRA